MKTMKQNSPLKDVCPDKELTNHSARKTVVMKLKSSGIPKCEIKTPLATAPSNDWMTTTPVMKTSEELCPTSSTMLQIPLPLQDKCSNHCSQCTHSQAGVPFKSIISAIVMSLSTSLEAILHNQVSSRASEVTRGSFFQILTLIKLYFVQINAS